MALLGSAARSRGGVAAALQRAAPLLGALGSPHETTSLPAASSRSYFHTTVLSEGGSPAADPSRRQPMASGTRGFAASPTDQQPASTDGQGEQPPPTIFELFDELAEEYADEPFLPMRYGNDDGGEKKRVRRAREELLQEQQARAWVRKVDADGVAHGVGGRKRAKAQARLWEHTGPSRPQPMINGRPFQTYFGDIDLRATVLAPFTTSGSLGRFDFEIFLRGGGSSGQAQAAQLALAKALQNYNPEFRSALRPAGLLTRDTRVVERKKPGRAKARKAFQWVKR